MGSGTGVCKRLAQVSLFEPPEKDTQNMYSILNGGIPEP